ncbi:hypothetical protein KIPB_001482 [Kipferlia bialata]|uniref:Uncharacterized protein n=1 Tax=Kipferlia bialata TaxID=797122 RepID=A0A9K3GFZ3_9EUKA|nr:hypothetical protein KIPB_001482 [Kipferlia bialata]|eukprot:g1482.t1
MDRTTLTFRHVTRENGVTRLVPTEPGLYSPCPFPIGYPRAGCKMDDKVFVISASRRRTEEEIRVGQLTLPTRLLIYTIDSDAVPTVFADNALHLVYTGAQLGHEHRRIIESKHFVFESDTEWQERRDIKPIHGCVVPRSIETPHTTLHSVVYPGRSTFLLAVYDPVSEYWTMILHVSFHVHKVCRLTATTFFVEVTEQGRRRSYILHVDHSYIQRQGGVLTAEDFF